MNKTFMKCFGSLVAVSLLALCCGEKPEPEPTPTPDPAPKAITLSPSSVSAPAEGGTYEVTVKTPFVPQVEAPSWVSVSNGTLSSYSVVTTLTVAANTEYEVRSATLTFKATGATSATLTVSQAAATKPDPPAPGYDGLASFFGLGWNLGNQMDAVYNSVTWETDKFGMPDETVWGSTKATKATFEGVRKAGFTSVRIPITWTRTIGSAPGYSIDESWLSRVEELVGFAHDAGLKVIINMHHDECHFISFLSDLDKLISEGKVPANKRDEWIARYKEVFWQNIADAPYNSELNTQIKEKIKGAWTQIANRFKDCGDDWLMMEGFNEINDGGWGWSEDFKKNPQKQSNTLNEWNQVFVDAVRATGHQNATRWLGVPSYCANPEFTKYMTIPTDPANKVAVSVHFYDPSDYTIGDAQYSDWGHTGAEGKKAAGSDEDHVKSVFGKLNSTYVAKGIPVYIGEFGCSMRSKSDTRAWAFYKYYMEYVVKAAKTYNLPCFLWDNGVSGSGKEKHGYINHGNGNYVGNSKEILDIISNAWSNDSDTYTLDYVYSKAPHIN